MNKVRLLRSILFLPASNARALEKARGLPCDVVALDLEDAVAPEEKDLARKEACTALAAGAFAGRLAVVRINALATQWGRDDLATVAKARPDAIILPKVAGAAQLRGAVTGVPLWAMIETPAGVLEAAAIAGAGAACLMLGSNDLMKDMRARPLAARENLWAAMSLTVMAARAHDIAAIDGSFNDVTDLAGFEAACNQGRAFGFDGKTLIHPSQIEIANRAFAPSMAEIQEARAILATFAAHPGKNVLMLDGRMIERLHAEEAARILALAEVAGC